jgi:hypothetical protein
LDGFALCYADLMIVFVYFILGEKEHTVDISIQNKVFQRFTP